MEMGKVREGPAVEGKEIYKGEEPALKEITKLQRRGGGQKGNYQPTERKLQMQMATWPTYNQNERDSVSGGIASV